MFTGLVEELGRVRAVTSRHGGVRLEITAAEILADAVVGGSIAVNGCCLTIVARDAGWWAADAQVETLDRTAIGDLRVGDAVNLERPLRLADRLGGHLVQGHVDGTGWVTGRRVESDGSQRLRFDAPGSVLRYLIEKGSVAVDGVSLTVAALDRDGFEVALVPHTLVATTLGSVPDGARVNLEPDLVAKYVERLTSPFRPTDDPATRS